MSFSSLSEKAGAPLIVPFSEEEIKQAVWNCDSFKSCKPDGINLGFIKDFWELLKDNMFRFFNEFHRHGKLTKGINNTFIALIPKVENPTVCQFSVPFLWLIAYTRFFLRFWLIGCVVLFRSYFYVSVSFCAWSSNS